MSLRDDIDDDVLLPDDDVESRSGLRECWPWLFPLAGLLLFEWLANPVVAAVVGCLKFGLEDFRTAVWLGYDPNRSRGEALRWCYLTSSLLKVVWSTVLVNLGLIALDGIWVVVLKGPIQNRLLIADVGIAGLVILVVGLVLGSVSACKAFRRVLRGRVQVWMDPTIHQARREQRWKCVCHGRRNRFRLLCITAILATSAWLGFLLFVFVFGNIQLPQQNRPAPQFFPLFGFLFFGWPAMYCLWLALRCWQRAATSPVECWTDALPTLSAWIDDESAIKRKSKSPHSTRDTNMAITVECETCSGIFTVRDALAGRTLTCPECGGPVIAIAESDEPVPLTEMPTRQKQTALPTKFEPRASSPNSSSRPQTATAISEPHQEDDERSGVWWVLGGIAVSLVVLLGVVAFAVNAWKAPQPQPVAKADPGPVAPVNLEPGAAQERAMPATADTVQPESNQTTRLLKYRTAVGDVWAFDVKVEIEASGFVETHQGLLTYQVLASRNSDFDLMVTGMMRPQRTVNRVDPGVFPPIPRPDFSGAIPSLMGLVLPRQLTVDQTGRVLRQTDVAHLPYFLGDAALFAIERLSEGSQKSWTVSNEVQVNLKELVPLHPHSRIGREQETTLGGQEKTDYVVKDASSPTVFLEKEYQLTAGSGDPKVELSGQGWVRFDTAAGTTVTSEMKLTLKQTSGNVTTSTPILLTYRKLSDLELAAQRERALAAAEAPKEQPANDPCGPAVPPPVKKAPAPSALEPPDTLKLPELAVNAQGQVLNEEALKAVVTELHDPRGESLPDGFLLDVGMVVVAKKPGVGEHLAAVREIKEDDKLLIWFLGDSADPIEVRRADLLLPNKQIARFVTASAFAINDKTKLARGMLLETERSGNRWRPVIVLETIPDGKVKIHYIGWANSWDSIVDRSKLRFPTGVTVDR